MNAELIVTNAKVLTMDAGRPRAEVVAIAGGKILAVGGSEVAGLAGPATRVIDAGGRTLLPGFVESHLHLVLGGNELVQLQIGGLYGFDALKAAFVAYAAANPDNALLMAQGASYEILAAPVTRHDLDRVIADRPIAMMSPDHHTVWANTVALQAAGLLQGAAMPHGHEVVMAEDGTASGELREFEAFGPVLALGGEALAAARRMPARYAVRWLVLLARLQRRLARAPARRRRPVAGRARLLLRRRAASATRRAAASCAPPRYCVTITPSPIARTRKATLRVSRIWLTKPKAPAATSDSCDASHSPPMATVMPKRNSPSKGPAIVFSRNRGGVLMGALYPC